MNTCRFRAASAVLVTVLAMLVGGLVPPASARAASAGNDAPLVLINGSLADFATGTGEPRLRGCGARGPRAGLEHAHPAARRPACAIPSAALPFLGRGLAPSLYDLGLLRALSLATGCRSRSLSRARAPTCRA